VPVLDGGGPLRLLHLSDLHLTPWDRDRVGWISRLAALEPDLVVVTGDFIAHRDAVEVVAEAFEGLLQLPGAFVFGSNDYYAPSLKNPARYLLPDDGRRSVGVELPWTQLRDLLVESGWSDLTHRRAEWPISGRLVELRGTDDAHLQRDRYEAVAGPRANGVDLAIGVTHAPYSRVIDAMAADGVDLILAGHTHGGQLCLPGIGALVTNCDLPTGQAKGLSSVSGVPMHVSAGLGTSPYTPVRFACRPEATLLTLVSR
jgi:predicted MPP superfamily phosphohydrolase